MVPRDRGGWTERQRMTTGDESLNRSGDLLAVPWRRLRLMVAVGGAWLAVLIALVAWWTYVVHAQAGQVAALQVAAGLLSEDEAFGLRSRTRNMLLWESVAFVSILLAASAVLGGLYFRDAQRNRALSAFFASLTHELRTPLTALRLQADALVERPGAGAPERAAGRRLLDELARLEAQVERTLELARVEGGGRVVEEPVALGPLLRHFCDALPDSLRQRAAIRLELPEGMPTAVLGDRVAIQLILRNLVENAVRHGGRERVQLGLRVERSGDGVRVVCEDDGAGFSGDRQRLGVLFFRGRDSSGAGVGLYLVRALMAQMRGTASFEPSQAGGFRARLGFREAGP
jgi:signal transduction histidine kinase